MPHAARRIPIFVLTLLAALPAAAQRGDDADRKSKNGRAEGTAGGAQVVVEYGRPNVAGREIWGELVPYGRIWRTGADEASTVSFDRDVLIEGERLAAGTYALFTVPGESSWTIVFNREAKQWGAFRHDAGQDVLRVEVTPREHGHVETFEIAVEPPGLAIRWAELEVPIAITAAG